ncbi:hypothetical protein GIB67_011997 [Kingdonia uniflora]|uniref:TRIP4/RQT4 C2HC5-type zinc finger domain-containing protein n=1 Tax=Kingdonia uniflora TaxID=39325 RepID=A0A7J7M060_9MAGN|nr:hypothetical protein GIB67_011997 [Kingdonia uniflora]
MKSGEWLEKALLNLGRNMETGLILDNDLVSGLVSYCESAPPQDAKEYLNNIVGEETGRSVIEEYVKMRGYTDIGSSSSSSASVSNSTLQAYVKPPPDKVLSSGTKKHIKQPKQVTSSSNQENRIPNEIAESGSIHKGKNPKKKKSGKVISLAEAAKGTIVFKQGQPCLCQARQHKLVSNCLSCGKIVCEQEGEGPCSFCGALVLKEGSTYAGLDETGLPLSDAEAVAEAYAKRLVDYDRNSAARTTVIDDQSDYYDIEGNTWLSAEEPVSAPAYFEFAELHIKSANPYLGITASHQQISLPSAILLILEASIADYMKNSPSLEHDLSSPRASLERFIRMSPRLIF